MDTAVEEKKDSEKKQKHDPVLNKPLFKKYIEPNLDEIRSLVFFYSSNKQEVDSNYNFVLTEMYKYIHSYDPSKSLKTWIHIVARRSTQFQNKKQYQAHCHDHGLSYDFDHDNGDDDDVLECGGGSTTMVVGNVIDNVSDKVLSALQRTPPALLSSFILYFQGYSHEEIVNIEYQRGYIDRNDPDAAKTIQNRIYMAKKIIKKTLAEYGITKTDGNW